MIARPPIFAAILVCAVVGVGCTLDFDEVGPPAQGAQGVGGAGADATSAGGGPLGGSGGAGGSGGGGAVVVHDCTNQQAECVPPPGELFVLADACESPLFSGGRGKNGGAVHLDLLDCNCACDAPCSVTVNRHAFESCATNLLGSFLLPSGACTEDSAGFDPSQYHTVGTASFDCLPSRSPDASNAFQKPAAACGFASLGCPDDQACLSTSAPVCLEKPMGGACPPGFAKEVDFLKEELVLDAACDCACMKGEEDSCPREVFAGATCAATTPLGECAKANALNYVGQGDCEVAESKSAAALISIKLCCNEAPPP